MFVAGSWEAVPEVLFLSRVPLCTAVLLLPALGNSCAFQDGVMLKERSDFHLNTFLGPSPALFVPSHLAQVVFCLKKPQEATKLAVE